MSRNLKEGREGGWKILGKRGFWIEGAPEAGAWGLVEESRRLVRGSTGEGVGEIQSEIRRDQEWF